MFEKLVEEKDELLYRYPYVLVTKNKIHIENYRRIYELTSDKVHVVFNSKDDEIIITGENIRSKYITDDILIMSGKIKTIDYINRKTKQSKE